MHYIKTGQVETIPWMTGINSEEGALETSALLTDPTLFNRFRDEFPSLVASGLGYEDLLGDVNATTTKLREFYFDDGVIDEASAKNISNVRVILCIRMSSYIVKFLIFFHSYIPMDGCYAQ